MTAPRMTGVQRRWLLGGVAAAAAAAGVGWSWRQTAGPAAKVGDAVWDLRFARPGGGELVLSSLRGKPLLLNFWATWCAPCVKEMPDLDRFHRERQQQGWQVLGIAIDREPAVQDFLKRIPVSFPVVLAGLPGSGLMRDLGNTQGVLPFSVVIDAGQRLREQHVGETSPALLQQWAQTHGT